MARLVTNDFDFNGQARLLNLPDPTAPQHAATRQWVDDNNEAREFGSVFDSGGSFALYQANPIILTTYIPSGSLGVVRDVQICASAPYKIWIRDVLWETEQGVGSSSVTLRTASGGLGTALTNALATTTANATSRKSFGVRYVDPLGQMWLRFTDGAVRGNLTMIVVRG